MSHVAMLIPTIDEIGGAERQVLLLATALSQRGWRVTLIMLSGSGDRSIEELRNSHVQLLRLGMRKAWVDPRGWIRYLVWARKNRPDILHAHLPQAVAFARWVRILSGVRVVIDTVHTSAVPSYGKRFLYRSSNWLSDQTTYVSRAVAETSKVAALVRVENSRVLCNGVCLPLLTSESYRTRVELQADRISCFQWIAIGRLAPVKDYPTLIRAFALLVGQLIHQAEQAELTIAGFGLEEQSLRALAEELGVASRVSFAGFCDKVEPFLLRSDGFVLSSLWEGLPISLLEAQAAGLPVVATNGSGTREAMIPEETGLLVPVGDVQALSEAMKKLMNSTPGRRLEMGRNGRQFVEDNFCLSKIVDQWEALYHQLLLNHTSRSCFGRWSIQTTVTQRRTDSGGDA